MTVLKKMTVLIANLFLVFIEAEQALYLFL